MKTSILSVDVCANKEEGDVLENCGSILPNNCLPCIATTSPTVEKRRSFTSSPPNSAKKAALKLSFKWKSGEAHTAPALCEFFCHSLFYDQHFILRPIILGRITVGKSHMF